MAKSTEEGEGAQAIVFETAHLVDLVWDKVLGWVEGFITMVPNLAVALIVVVFFSLLARFGSRFVAKAIRRAHVNEQLSSLAGMVARVTFLSLGLFLSLGVLELQKTAVSLLAGVGVVGLALGFAFQDIASNFMSGVIMAIRRPFALGDLIETGDTTGHVRAVNLRATVVRNFSGQRVIIPNKDVLQSPIINYSREGQRRIEIPVGVAYDTDLDHAREVAVDAVSHVSGLQEDAEVKVVYTGFGGSSVDLEVQYWLDLSQEGSDYLTARSQGIVEIHRAFGEAGIEIPFPIRTLDFPDRDPDRNATDGPRAVEEEEASVADG